MPDPDVIPLNFKALPAFNESHLSQEATGILAKIFNYDTWAGGKMRRNVAARIVSYMEERGYHFVDARSPSGFYSVEFESAIGDIILERKQQVEDDGRDAAHDDHHSDGELIEAAVAYIGSCLSSSTLWSWYPWTGLTEEKKNRIKLKPTREKLVIAAALIVAEIERIDRAKASESLAKTTAGIVRNLSFAQAVQGVQHEGSLAMRACWSRRRYIFEENRKIRLKIPDGSVTDFRPDIDEAIATDWIVGSKSQILS